MNPFKCARTVYRSVAILGCSASWQRAWHRHKQYSMVNDVLLPTRAYDIVVDSDGWRPALSRHNCDYRQEGDYASYQR